MRISQQVISVPGPSSDPNKSLGRIAMHQIIVEKPYRFIQPHRGEWIPFVLEKLRVVDRFLDRYQGIVSYEIRGIEHLKESLRIGAGIILTPNHCRYSDPMVMGWVMRPLNAYPFVMASWHLFQSPLQALAIRWCGGFSVNREGVDRHALDTAIGAIVEGKRPLILFPEGTVFRNNDLLQPLLDGVSFIARSAARRRSKQGKPPTVIHPIALKYLFKGDVLNSINPVVETLESRFTWYGPIAQTAGMLERVHRLSNAFLTAKELEHLGDVGSGCVVQRRSALIEHLLTSVESRWLTRPIPDRTILPRIKALRLKMVPELLSESALQSKKNEIRCDLNRIYVAQQVASYPNGYLADPVTNTRLLETVEQLEEDILDRARIHRPLHVIIQVAPPIEVSDARPEKNGGDPLLTELDTALRGMLGNLAQEAPVLSSMT
jgi:1-acyl-sn-glycerol-3-phosphate acyltransferase